MEFLILQTKVVGSMNDKCIHAERAFVQKQVEAFPGSQFSPAVLRLDSFRAATLPGRSAVFF
jgi:hypothetical protein